MTHCPGLNQCSRRAHNTHSYRCSRVIALHCHTVRYSLFATLLQILIRAIAVSSHSNSSVVGVMTRDSGYPRRLSSVLAACAQL